MKNLVEQLREMVEKSREKRVYPTFYAEGFVANRLYGWSAEREREMFTKIADRIEREYVELQLDADGMPIKPNDKVFFVGSDEPFDVLGFLFESGEVLIHIGRLDKTSTDSYVEPEELSHKPTDTLESIEADARKTIIDYWMCDGAINCKNCPAVVDGKKPWERYGTGGNCSNAKSLDLLRRMREVLERE